MKTPSTLESVSPCSGEYSWKKDLKLNAWFAVAAAAYLVTLFLAKHHAEWSPLTRALVALTPLAPGLLYVRACLRFVRSLDELQRRIQLEAWLFAALGTLLIGTIVNTLNAHGVDLGQFAHGLSLSGMFILLFTLWLVGTGLANCRYK